MVLNVLYSAYVWLSMYCKFLMIVLFFLLVSLCKIFCRQSHFVHVSILYLYSIYSILGKPISSYILLFSYNSQPPLTLVINTKYKQTLLFFSSNHVLLLLLRLSKSKVKWSYYFLVVLWVCCNKIFLVQSRDYFRNYLKKWVSHHLRIAHVLFLIR